jgi:hypothetical protein
VYVSGYTSSAATSGDYSTVAYDAASGLVLWVRSLDGSSHDADDAYALAVSPDGSNVYVTGASFGVGTGPDYVTVAYDATTGARRWARRYNGPGNDEDLAYGVAVSPDSSIVIVTGLSMGTGSGLDYATVAYKAKTGAPLWGRRYNGPGNGDDVAVDVAVSVDGTYVYATGYAASGASEVDCATVSYLAASGTPVGVRRYNGPGNGTDWGTDIAVSAERVLVTGWGEGDGTGLDYATLAYLI